MLKSEYKNIYENQNSHWWYLGMAKINETLLDKYLPKKKGLKILDAGCGTGAAFYYLKKYGHVTAIDFSEDAIKYAKRVADKAWVLQKGDVNKLKFKNESFDLVICLDVLYHMWVKDYEETIDEYLRVLKKDGILLLREPSFEWLKGNEDYVGLTKLRFTSNILRRVFRGKHARILKITYANFFLLPLVFLKRLPVTLGLSKKGGSSDIFKSPDVINKLLLSFLNTEAGLVKYTDLPFGSSVICIVKKR